MNGFGTGLEQLNDSELYLRAIKMFAREEDTKKSIVLEALSRIDQKQYEIDTLEEVLKQLGSEFVTLQ
jgi:hypothetical protein